MAGDRGAVAISQPEKPYNPEPLLRETRQALGLRDGPRLMVGDREPQKHVEAYWRALCALWSLDYDALHENAEHWAVLEQSRR